MGNDVEHFVSEICSLVRHSDYDGLRKLISELVEIGQTNEDRADGLRYGKNIEGCSG